MKKQIYLLFVLGCTGFILLITACSKEDSQINLFSVNDDIELGQQVDQEIRSKPLEYPVVDSVQYAVAYAHLYRIRNTILASGELIYADRFQWKCTILDNDTVINAFCVPGGNMYFYTGIIKLLDNEAQFAGVMAHEMAHADRRHTTDQLSLAFGVDLLFQLLLGNNQNQLAEIAASLAGNLGFLAYSRNNEYAADRYAVRYLYPTEYDAASLGDFFLMMHNQSHPPAFLSTHPSPDDRLEKIQEEFLALGGVHGQYFPDRYQEFILALP